MDSGIYLNSLKTEIKPIKLLSDKEADKKSRSELKEYVDDIIDTIDDDDIKIKDFQQSCQSIIQNLNGSIIQLINLSQIHLEGDYSYTGKINLTNIDMNEYLGEEVQINSENQKDPLQENLSEFEPEVYAPDGQLLAPEFPKITLTPDIIRILRPTINIYTDKTYTGDNTTIERKKGKCSGPFPIENHKWFENDGENIIDKLFNNCDFDKYKQSDDTEKMEIIMLNPNANGTLKKNMYNGTKIKFIPFLYLVYNWKGWEAELDSDDINVCIDKIKDYNASSKVPGMKRKMLDNSIKKFYKSQRKVPYNYVSTYGSYGLPRNYNHNDQPATRLGRITGIEDIFHDKDLAATATAWPGLWPSRLTNASLHNNNAAQNFIRHITEIQRHCTTFSRIREGRYPPDGNGNTGDEFEWDGLRDDYSCSKYEINKNKTTKEIIKRFINLTITKLPIYYFDCKKEINELNSIYSACNLLKNLLLENGSNTESSCEYPDYGTIQGYKNAGYIFKLLLNEGNLNLIKKGKNQKTTELKDYDIKIHNFDSKEFDELKFLNLMNNNWKLGYPFFRENQFDIDNPCGFPVSKHYENSNKCPGIGKSKSTGGNWQPREVDAWKQIKHEFEKDVNDSLSVYFEDGITGSKFYILEFRHKLSDSNNAYKSRPPFNNTNKSYFHLVEVLKFKEAKTYSILIHMENFIEGSTIKKKRFPEDNTKTFDKNYYEITSSISKLSENSDYINVYPKPLIRTKDVIFNDISKQRYDYMIENGSFITNMTSTINNLSSGISTLSKSPATTTTIAAMLGTSAGLSFGLIGAMVVGLAYKNYKSSDENYGMIDGCREYVSNYLGYNQLMDNIDINNLGLIKLKDNEKDTIRLLENSNLLGTINNRMRARGTGIKQDVSESDRDNEETIINKFIEISKTKINVSSNTGVVANLDSKNIKNRWMKLRDNYIQLMKKQLATYLMPIKSNYITNVDNLYDSNIEEGISGLQNTTTFIGAFNELKDALNEPIHYDDATIDNICNKFYGKNKDEIYEDFKRKISGLSNTPPADSRIIIPQFYDFLLPVGNIDDPSRYYDLISDSIFLNHYSLNALEKIDDDIKNSQGVAGAAQGPGGVAGAVQGPGGQVVGKNAPGAVVPLPVKKVQDQNLALKGMANKAAGALQAAVAEVYAAAAALEVAQQNKAEDIIIKRAEEALQKAQEKLVKIQGKARKGNIPNWGADSTMMNRTGAPPESPAELSVPKGSLAGGDEFTRLEWMQLLYCAPGFPNDGTMMGIYFIDQWYDAIIRNNGMNGLLNKSKSSNWCEEKGNFDYLVKIFKDEKWDAEQGAEYEDHQAQKEAKYICEHLKRPIQPPLNEMNLNLQTFSIISYEKKLAESKFFSNVLEIENYLKRMYDFLLREQGELLQKATYDKLRESDGIMKRGILAHFAAAAKEAGLTDDIGVAIGNKVINIYNKPPKPAEMPFSGSPASMSPASMSPFAPDVSVVGTSLPYGASPGNSLFSRSPFFTPRAKGGGRKQKGGAMVGNIQRALSSPQQVDQAMRDAAAGGINHFKIDPPNGSNLQVSTQRTIPGEKYRKYAQQVVLYYLQDEGIDIGMYNISDSFIMLGLYVNGIKNLNDIIIALQIIKYIIDNYSSFYGNINKVVSKIEEESKKITKKNDSTDNSSKKEKNVIVDEELSLYDNISGLDDIFKDFTKEYFGSLYTYFLYGPPSKENVSDYYIPYYFYSKNLLEKDTLNQESKDYLLNLLPLLPVNDTNYNLDTNIYDENNFNDIKIENINIGTKVVNHINFTFMVCDYERNGLPMYNDQQNLLLPIWFKRMVSNTFKNIEIKTTNKDYDFRTGINILEDNNDIILYNWFEASYKYINHTEKMDAKNLLDQLPIPSQETLGGGWKRDRISSEKSWDELDNRSKVMAFPHYHVQSGGAAASALVGQYPSLSGSSPVNTDQVQPILRLSLNNYKTTFYIKYMIDHNNYPYEFVNADIIRDNNEYRNIYDSKIVQYLDSAIFKQEDDKFLITSLTDKRLQEITDIRLFDIIYNLNDKIIVYYDNEYYKFDIEANDSATINKSLQLEGYNGSGGGGEIRLTAPFIGFNIKSVNNFVFKVYYSTIKRVVFYISIEHGKQTIYKNYTKEASNADFAMGEYQEKIILYRYLSNGKLGPLLPPFMQNPTWEQMHPKPDNMWNLQHVPDLTNAGARPAAGATMAGWNGATRPTAATDEFLQDNILYDEYRKGSGQIYPFYIEHNYVKKLSDIRLSYMSGLITYKNYINTIRYIYSCILYRYKIIKEKTIDNLLKIFELCSADLAYFKIDYELYIRAIIHSYFFEEKINVVSFEDYANILKYTVDIINILNVLFFSYNNNTASNRINKSKIISVLNSMIQKSSTIELNNSLNSIKNNSNMKCDNIYFKNTNMCAYNPENESYWVKPENIKVPHIDYIINKLKLRYVLRIFYKNKRMHDNNINKINKFKKDKLNLLQQYMPDTLSNLYNNVMKFRKTNDKKEITKSERNKGSSGSSDSSQKQERIEDKKSESKTISKDKNKFKVGDIVSLPDNSIGKIIKIMDNKQYQVKKRDGSIITIRESDLKLYKGKEKEKEKEKSKFNIGDNVLIISKNKMGEIIGITSDGKYIIKLEDGTIIEINSSDIRIIDGEIKKGDNVKLSNGNIGELVGITPSGDYIIKLKNGTVISISNKKSVEKIKIKKEEIKRDESVDVDKLQNELDSLIIDKQRNEKLILQLNEDLRNYKLERNGLESEERQKRLRDYERKQKELNYIKNSLYLKNQQVKSLKLLIEKEIERNKMIEENKLNSKLLDEKRNIELMKKKMYDISKKDHERNKLLKTSEKDKEIELLRKKNKEYEELMKKNKISFNKYKRDESLDESIPIYSIKRTPKKVKANVSKKKKSDKKKKKSSLDDLTKTLKKML